MKVKLAVALAALVFAVGVRADSSQQTYTITLNALEVSSPAPTPTFGVGTIDTQFEQYGEGSFLDFNLTPDVGAPTAGIVIPNFGVADTGPIYFCEGCNVPYPATNYPTPGAYIPLTPGEVNIYYPANGPSGSPDMYTIEFAFPPTPGYFIYGTLEFADPPPMNTPEPSTWMLLVAGIAFLLARATKGHKQLAG
jgi:hypothetical protein